MLYTKHFIIFGTLFCYVNTNIVDNFPKCKINDGECARVLIGDILHDIAATGIPELGIPPIDPIELNNITVVVLDGITITLKHGLLKGIKDCVADKFDTDITTKKAVLELRCDVNIRGKYKVLSSSPTIKAVLGGDVHGDGNVKVKIEQLHLRIDFRFFLDKRDGEVYFASKNENIKYRFDILRNMEINIDHFYLGKQDASQMVSSLFNQNWKALMGSFGKPFIDKSMELIFNFLHRFYDVIPTSRFVVEDLSQYD